MPQAVRSNDALGTRRRADRPGPIYRPVVRHSAYRTSLTLWQRLVWFAAGIVLGLVLGVATGMLHAQDLDGTAYAMWYEGELAPTSQPEQAPVFTIWDRLAQCESGGNWHVDAYHDGGLQFLPSTWTAWRLSGYPRYAWQATREQQIETATRLQRAAGWGQWPACSRRLGLR